MKRAERRAAKNRMKVKARKLYPDKRCPERYADYLCACSCPMCRNQRRDGWHKGDKKLTVQERRAISPTEPA